MHDEPMTPEQANRALLGFHRQAEIDGLWEARCPCGAVCGQKLGDASQPPYPQGDPHIACPSCHRVGSGDGIHYVYISPEELR